MAEIVQVSLRGSRREFFLNSRSLWLRLRDKVISFETFVRLPWVSWAAPRAVQSDMAGPSLLGLVGGEVIGGKAQPRVLKPSGNVTLPDGGAGLEVSDAEKRSAVQRFLKG